MHKKKIGNLITEKTSIGTDEIHIAYCPERVLPGQILKELITNDRVVGGLNNTSTEKGKNFYQSFVKEKYSQQMQIQQNLLSLQKIPFVI